MSTDLGRSIRNMSTLMQVLVPIHLGILGKSADFGARTYIKAAQISLDGHVSRTDSHLTRKLHEFITHELSRGGISSLFLQTMNIKGTNSPILHVPTGTT